jgi:hypothetical protein
VNLNLNRRMSWNNAVRFEALTAEHGLTHYDAHLDYCKFTKKGARIWLTIVSNEVRGSAEVNLANCRTTSY